MLKIVLASNNKGKIKEINHLVSPYQMEVIAQSEFKVEEVEETGLTFVENALLKARNAASITSLPALADDSGLVVPILNGEPGIYSARYAGTNNDHSENIKKLLFKLKDVPEKNRNAYFYTVIVLLRDVRDPSPIICEGIWHGKILHEPKGDKGFGYDPIFFDPEYECSAAELPLEIKNKISHRGQAMQQLLHKLEEIA